MIHSKKSFQNSFEWKALFSVYLIKFEIVSEGSLNLDQRFLVPNNSTMPLPDKIVMLQILLRNKLIMGSYTVSEATLIYECTLLVF